MAAANRVVARLRRFCSLAGAGAARDFSDDGVADFRMATPIWAMLRSAFETRCRALFIR